MAKRLTIEFVKASFELDGYILLTEEYVNNTQKLDYICPKGHYGNIMWLNWQKGKRCLKCSGKEKLTIEFIKEQFASEGYTFLTKKYIGAHQKLKYICSSGHRSSITWGCWQQGNRCIKCAGLKKLTIDFIKKEFKKVGYTLLTTEYINNKQKLEYICPNGHCGNISWNTWQRGARCLECAGNKKYTIEFIREELKKEKYILLSNEYNNAHDKLEFICSEGHSGNTCWHSWRKGHRCAECAGKKKLTIEFIRKEFKKEGFTLLTKEYVNSAQKLEYICKKRHIGNINWGSWQQGHRCAECYFESTKGENSPHWNPSLTDKERISGRSISGYENWAYAVKERDNFTCQICEDNKGGNLVSHHIESYTANPELRTELSNGITLCEKCHKNFHHKCGYGNNTREQFEEFVAQISQEFKNKKETKCE